MMKKITQNINLKTIISTLFFVLCVSISFSQNEKCYDSKIFVNQLDTLKYRIMMPKNFDTSKQYPIVLFLHGAGERGNDNKAQLLP